MKKNKAVTVAEETSGADRRAVRVPAKEELLEVEYALVDRDPDQPRKTFTEESIRELADSIAANGLAQRVVVQRVPVRYRVEAPDLTHDDWCVYDLGTPAEPCAPGEPVFRAREENLCQLWADKGLTERFKIIFGERRWWAVGVLGWAKLPVIVREITERDRFALQFVENAQRENVSTLEEALAMASEFGRRKAENPEYKVEDLAAELGISRAAAYERLKLTRLSHEVQEALRAGKISTSVAGVVATVPTPKDQVAMLKRITDEGDYHFPWSVRDVQTLTEKYFCQLDDAPFDRERGDYHLETDSGPKPACGNCPHRTGNMLAEFPELASRPNVCTLPGCFETKCRAHYAEQAAAFEKKGHKVVSRAALNAEPEAYYRSHDMHYGVARNGTTVELMGRHAPKSTVTFDEEGIQEWYAKSEFEAACKKNKVALRVEQPAEPKAFSKEEARAAKQKHEQERAEWDALRVRKQEFVLGILPALAKSLGKIKEAVAWKIVRAGMDDFSQYDQDADYYSMLVEDAKTDRAKVLGTLFSALLVVCGDASWVAETIQAWKLAGVDVLALWEKHEKAAQPALVLPKDDAPKDIFPSVGKAKVKKGKLNKASIAKIKAAQKARWAKIKAAQK